MHTSTRSTARSVQVAVRSMVLFTVVLGVLYTLALTGVGQLLIPARANGSIVYDAEGRAHALPESALPVELPDIPDYSPVSFDPDDADSEPSPPLGKATEWVHVELDLGDGLQT